MRHVPPLAPADELVLLDRELAQLDARKGQLLLRRAWLLRILNSPAPPLPHTPWQHAPRPPAAAATTAATSARSAQNVLLTLGGILLAVAALAFTLVGWGQLGIAGRSAVLGLVSVAALSAPALLVRRGLAATAESVGVLALLLTVLDVYALHEVAFENADGTAYSAVAAALLALLWASYGLFLPRLRTPLPAALLAAQLPLALWVLSHSTTELPFSWALLATAALDTAAAVWAVRHRAAPTTSPTPTTVGSPASAGTPTASPSDRTPPAGPSDPANPAGPAFSAPQAGRAGPAAPVPTPAPSPAAVAAPPAGRAAQLARALVPVGVLAAVCAWAAGGYVLLAALVMSVNASTAAEALPSSGLLLASAALALAATLRHPQLATALVAGLALVAATAGTARPALPLAWTAPAYVVCALAVLALSAARGPRLPRPVRHGLTASAALVGAGAVLTTVPALALTLLSGPASRAAAPWQGLPPTLRRTVDLDVPWHALSTAPLILLLTAAALAVLHRRSPHPATVVASVLSASAAVLLLPTSLNLPYVAALSLYVALTAVTLALAARAPAPAPTPAPTAVAPGVRTALSYAALGVGAVTAGAVSCLALASRGTTFAVLGALLVLFAALAVRTRAPAVRAVGAVAAVGYATGLACAGAAALALPPQQAALLVLVVPAMVALLAVRVHSVPAEIAATVPALLAVALAAGRAPMLSLVLALCGVIAAGTAVRQDRRAVGWAAGALFLLATWVRLAASGIGEPEAYTLPVTVPALVVGVLRRRRDPQASSWTAYGPGLAATLLPSLVAAWADPYWLRPLLLGLAALVVTLLGARHRLGAPLLLGGAVLSLVALHELAPYVVQVVGALPRWLPPALAGLLLLAVGATYEQRLRDARRLRERLGRLH
ncbi:SCO7613 C-terminal domain-containing membrane protein [Streptomyces sp. NPDC054863]